MIQWKAVDLWLERPAVEVVVIVVAMFIIIQGLRGRTGG